MAWLNDSSLRFVLPTINVKDRAKSNSYLDAARGFVIDETRDFVLGCEVTEDCTLNLTTVSICDLIRELLMLKFRWLSSKNVNMNKFIFLGYGLQLSVTITFAL